MRYNRISEKPNLERFLNFSENSFLSRLNQDHYCFTHIFEMRITFSCSFRDMTYEYYLKHQLAMCEIELNQILAKNPRLINRLNRFSSSPYTRKHTNQEIKFDDERN